MQRNNFFFALQNFWCFFFFSYILSD
jgi:hypothetical protein